MRFFMLIRANKALLPISAVATALALTLAGCSATTDKAPEYEDGPLMKYLTALWEGEDMTNESFEAEQLKVEELVAVCMQKEGFEYEPNVQSMGMMMPDEEMEGPEYGSKEFAEQYGYGTFDSPWISTNDEDEQEYVDPNQDYVDSLSESEQSAYYATLYGDSEDLTEEQQLQLEEDGSYTTDWTQQGCQGAAYHEVQGEAGGAQAAYEDPEFADLFTAMDEIWTAEPTEETTALNSEWAACMADSGFSEFLAPDDAQNSIWEAQNALYENLEYVEGEDAPEPDKKDIDELKKRELEVAVADYECRQKTDYDKKQMKIQHVAEQKFVDEHKAELDAMLAKYQAKSGSQSEKK